MMMKNSILILQRNSTAISITPDDDIKILAAKRPQFLKAFPDTGRYNSIIIIVSRRRVKAKSPVRGIQAGRSCRRPKQPAAGAARG